MSRASGVSGAKGNFGSVGPSISSDGRFVAFRSSATNLDPADPDTTGDVYVRDLQTGTTTLVSRADGTPGAKGNGQSYAPVTSADGVFVAFYSSATNLDPLDPDTLLDVCRVALDSDADGLPNADEAATGTNPQDPDTDDDGLNDGAEVRTYGTNPLNADSDDDGVNDGAEVAAGSEPARSGPLPGRVGAVRARRAGQSGRRHRLRRRRVPVWHSRSTR